MPTRPPRPVTSLWKRKDKRGLWTEFQYDPAGNATNVVTTGNLTGEPGVQSAAHIAFYNSNNLPVLLVDAAGNSNVPNQPSDATTSS